MKAYKIRYTPSAVQDLDQTWADICDVSKERDIADRYISGLIEKIEAKKSFPDSGVPLLYRGLFTGFYYTIFKKYMIFYRIKDEYIEVVRVLLAKRDYLQVLFPEQSVGSSPINSCHQ